MAAHPRHTPTPQEMPRIGQRARPTTPFSTQRRALSERSRITITDDCWRCGGTGFVDRPYVECEECHRIWTEEQVAAHLGHGWRSKRLPCGHAVPNGIIYVNAQCQTCGGGRELPQTVSFGELLVWMKDWFERWYAELSAETTAVQPTFERTHDPREREERNTPRLPDIPRVRRE